MTAVPLLAVDGVDVSFGGLAALADVSFDMVEGQIKGLIGPNGAGKSTLFNVIAGVTRPNRGRVTFRGDAIEQLPAHRRIRLGIARTFQNLQLFRDLTVVENVMVGCHVRFGAGLVASILHLRRERREEEQIREIALAQLKRLHLAHKAFVKASDLSFGEAKILEIARALAAEPTLLLLDEPVAGIPHAEVAHVAGVIREINRGGVSVLLVEHNMGFVMNLCDDIVVLNSGRKIADGTAAAVRVDPQVLVAYLGEEAPDA
jgi:branched-chain amino acid transport system ATP-binding protein